jgi:hypothetical protein
MLRVAAGGLLSRDRPSFEGYKSRMAPTSHMLSPAQSEIVSPELVLVDPRLATDARGLLSDPDDTVTRLEQEPSPDSAEPHLPVESVEAGSSANEEVAGARQRLTALSEVEPPKRRSLHMSVVSRLRRRRAPSSSS